MKTIFIICGLIFVSIVAWLAISFKTPNHYGSTFSGAPRVEVEALLERPTEFLGRQLSIQGKIADQCPTTGCFFYFYAGTGNKKLKIELGDLAQKIPKRRGALILVEGQLVAFGDSYQFLGTAAEFKYE